MIVEEDLFSVKNLERLLRNPLVQSLGEITRWPDILEEGKSPDGRTSLRKIKRYWRR